MAGDYYRRKDMNGPDYEPDGTPIVDVMQGNVRNESDLFLYSFLSGLPYLGNFMQAYGQHQDLLDYMNNYGIDWNQLKAWRVTNRGISGLARSGTNFVSDMIKDLYE